MATPAQVMNDMVAQARFYERRDKRLHDLCVATARMIADLMAGTPVDGRRWGKLHCRLLANEGSRGYPIAANITRARLACEALRRGEGGSDL